MTGPESSLLTSSGDPPKHALLTFTVYGTAAPAGSKRGFHNAKTGRTSVVDDSKRSRPWKAQVTDAAAGAMGGRQLLAGPLRLDLVFYVARPQGHFGTGRNAGAVRSSAPAYPAVKPDVLKLTRAVEDALSGVVYRDDAQIVEEFLWKRYTVGQARVDVRVTTIDEEDAAA